MCPVRCAPADNFRVKDAEADRSLFVLDWLFIATTASARSFGRIHTDYSEYEQAIVRRAAVPPWGHFYWAHHVTRVLALSMFEQ